MKILAIDKFIVITLVLLINSSQNIIGNNSVNTFNKTFYYATNESQLSQKDKGDLLHFIDSLKTKGDIIKIEIIGSCDDMGNKNYNKILSQKRAACVRDIILDRNNLESLLSINGIGEKSINVNSSQSVAIQRANNRNVNIIISCKEWGTSNIFKDSYKVGDKILLKGILFIPGSANLLEESKVALLSLINSLKANPNICIQIQGHIYAPDKKYDDFNPQDESTLSFRRAKKIYNYLLINHIEEERLSCVGYEGKYPLGRLPKYDRRVEVEITNK